MKGWIGRFLLVNLATMAGAVFAQEYPAIAEGRRIEMLRHPTKRPVRMVFDTDTYNEIDDQFALVPLARTGSPGGLRGAVPQRALQRAR